MCARQTNVAPAHSLTHHRKPRSALSSLHPQCNNFCVPRGAIDSAGGRFIAFRIHIATLRVCLSRILRNIGPITGAWRRKRSAAYQRCLRLPATRRSVSLVISQDSITALGMGTEMSAGDNEFAVSAAAKADVLRRISNRAKSGGAMSRACSQAY